MKTVVVISIVISVGLLSCRNDAKNAIAPSKHGKFNTGKDFLLANFDCKTDVDDLHSVAAFAMLLSNPEFSGIRYHAVAGTYGIQEGLYVPPEDLFNLAFGKNWTNAHADSANDFANAVEQVLNFIKETLVNGGDIWIAEAGQSDFTARLIKNIQNVMPDVSTSMRIHVVQHADWNEQVTSAENLQYVKDNADYMKIPDGNVVGNGTPGFRSPAFREWTKFVKNPTFISIWQLAIDLSNRYNARDGRYNNEAVTAGGLDFSDLAEVCWILGIADIKNSKEFFTLYGN